jgi:ABC-type uncharacterized transport system substrate-binding protein
VSDVFSTIVAEGPYRAMKRLLAFLIASAGFSVPALAHPHVFVEMQAEVMFAPDGKVAGVRHHWKFDDMYSAFVTANMAEPGKDPSAEQMLPIAKTNVESLKEFDFFTFMKINGAAVKFSDSTVYNMTYDGKDQTVTLHFELPLEGGPKAGKASVIQVYDPSYFVAFAFAKTEPAKLDKAPAGCSMQVVKAGTLSAEDQAKLAASAGTYDSPGDDFGAKLADSIIAACP